MKMRATVTQQEFSNTAAFKQLVLCVDVPAKRA
jgi:hypothetical protein